MTIRTMILAAAFTIALAGCGGNARDSAPGAAPPAQSSASVASTSGGAVPPKLRSTIASTLKIDESKVTPSATFVTDLGADELDLVELAMAYDREFEVDVRKADADRFMRVQDVMSFLQKHGALR